MNTTHNIAIDLEHYLRAIHNKTERNMGTKLDADCIESDYFYDAMMEILNHYNINTESFSIKYKHFQKVSMKKILNYEEIYSEFKSMLKNNNIII